MTLALATKGIMHRSIINNYQIQAPSLSLVLQDTINIGVGIINTINISVVVKDPIVI